MAEYRLETLLNLRQRREEAAKQAFASAVGRLRDEENRQKAFEDELEQMVKKREEKRKAYAEKIEKGSMLVTDQLSAHRYIERMKELEEAQQSTIRAQIEVVAEARTAMEQTQSELIEASQELKALDKHKEKWEGERRRARMLKEEDNLDEIAQTIYQNQKKNN